MERKQISEITKLKIQNCNLMLQLLQWQSSQILKERDAVLLEEAKCLRCDLKKWELNVQTWEFIRKGGEDIGQTDLSKEK